MIDLTQFEGHTPGPWTKSKEFDQTKAGFRVQPIEAKHGACGECGTGPGSWLIAWLHPKAVRKSEYKANVALIAAAPSLLEEVKRLREAAKALYGVLGIQVERVSASGQQWYTPEEIAAMNVLIKATEDAE